MKFNKLIKKAVATVLAAAMLVTVVPAAPVEAATYTATTAKKVKTITKTGQHVVVVPANSKENYVQFKAPKAGTYVFNFDGICYAGEDKDVEKSDYFTKETEAYAGMVNAAPIVGGMLGTQFSLVNVHSMYSAVAYLKEMSMAEMVEAAEAEGWSLEDICKIGAQAGIELTHCYSVKLKKGQIIQFDFMNMSVAQKLNKKKQNVVITIKKK